MRSSLVVAGGMIILTGVVLWVALDGEAWLALIAGGAVALVCGFVLEEVTDRVEAPLGQHFCPFCSTAVADEDERCSHCNGLQDWTNRSKLTQSQPNS
jgi:hypothetical protein